MRTATCALLVLVLACTAPPDDVDASTPPPRDSGTARIDAYVAPDAPTADTTPDASVVASPIVGVYVGNDPPAIGQFETWLGEPVGGVLAFTGGASWEDYDGSVGWRSACGRRSITGCSGRCR